MLQLQTQVPSRVGRHGSPSPRTRLMLIRLTRNSWHSRLPRRRKSKRQPRKLKRNVLRERQQSPRRRRKRKRQPGRQRKSTRPVRQLRQQRRQRRLRSARENRKRPPGWQRKGGRQARLPRGRPRSPKKT